MCDDWIAYAVIGCPVPEDALYTVKKAHRCHCAPRTKAAEAMRYCPICGGPMWRTVYVPNFKPAPPDCRPELGGIPLYFGGVDDIGPRRVAVAGFLAATDEGAWYPAGYWERAELPDDLTEIKARTKEALEPLGLWDPATFGLWAIVRRV